MVTNKAEWREKSEKTVKTRLQRQMREEEYSEEIELKFESFKKFLIRKGTSNKMTNTFFWRRFFTALIVSTHALLTVNSTPPYQGGFSVNNIQYL